MSIRDTFFLVSALQTLIISILLLFYNSRKKNVNRYLGLFFVTLFIELLMYFLVKAIKHPAIYHVPLKFDFLSLTFLFFYALKTSGIKVKSEFNYFIPAIIEFVVLSIIFILVIIDPGFHKITMTKNFLLVHKILSSIYIIIMSALTIKIIIKHKKLLPIYFSETKFKSLLWLTVFCVICITFNVIRHLNYIFPDDEFLSITLMAISLLTLYYITIASLIQININNVIPSSKDAILGKKELEAIFKNIDEYVLKHKTYLDPEVSLKTFSRCIDIPERSISKAINRIDNRNFNNYINCYRVEEFKRLLASGKYEKYSISAIANEVGFSSRASFYKNFKEIVGVSPSIYAKSISS